MSVEDERELFYIQGVMFGYSITEAMNLFDTNVVVVRTFKVKDKGTLTIRTNASRLTKIGSVSDVASTTTYEGWYWPDLEENDKHGSFHQLGDIPLGAATKSALASTLKSL